MAARRKLLATMSAVAALALASAAFAGKLPAPGIWVYDGVTNTATGATFRAYVRVDAPGKASVYSFNAIVFSGVCKMKTGKIVKGNPIAASVLKTTIVVKANGSFAGTRTALGDSGGKGTLAVKGVITGA